MANSFKLNVVSSISDTTDTLINTAPALTTAVVHSLYLTNIGTATTYANVIVNDGSANAYIAYNAPIPVGDSLILDKPINLSPGSSIYARGVSLNAVLSTLEIS